MADILIYRMKMPENEPLRLVLNPNGQLFVDHGVTFTEYEAVELPEHGDLIDLDERLTGIIYDEHNNDTDMVTMTAREWLGSVDDIPTVIVPSNKEETE